MQSVGRAPGFVTTYTFGLLYETEPLLDARLLADRLAKEDRVEVVSQSDAIVQLAHPEYPVRSDTGEIPSLSNIVRWFKPLDPAEFADALDQTWDWPDAEKAVSRCRYKLIASDLTGAALPYKDRYHIISSIALALAETTSPTVIHWEPAGCLVDPRRLARRLHWACNVRLHDILNRKGEELMDTLGLAALGLNDAQCHYRGLDSSEMARWMYGLGRRIFIDGGIAEGEAIPALVENERWTTRNQMALIPPPRPVIDVTPARRNAGRP